MLTPLELAIMRSLWKRGKATVREVQGDLAPERQLAYTTVMTVMDRLFKKGLAERRKKSRAHIYTPEITEKVARDEALEALLQGFFGGSREKLRSSLQKRDTARALEVSDDASRLEDTLL